MWRELAERIHPDGSLGPPASELALNDIEAALGVGLPPELRALLREANGIRDRYGNGILSAEQILQRNLEMRSDADQDDLYMPFAPLLFFADAGNGDLFGFPIQGDGNINRPDVFHWNHETDSRVWIAKDLQQFVEKWFSGQLMV